MMPIEDNSRAKSDKQYFESSPKVDKLPDIRDAEGHYKCYWQIVTEENEQLIYRSFRPEIRRYIEEICKMSIEDNNRAKSDKQHFGSSSKVEKLPDIRDAEAYDECHLRWQNVTGTRKNVQGIGGCISPEIRRRIDEMRKKNTNIGPSPHAIRRGPPAAAIGSSISPKIRRKIERWYKSVESTTGPKIPMKVDIYRRPVRNGGKREKKSSALSDGKKDKKVA